MFRFTGTKSVDYIKDSYGTCETAANVTTESNKVKCRNEMNGQWVPDLDISGLNCSILQVAILIHNVLLAPELSMRLYYVEIIGLISHIHNLNTEYLQHMFTCILLS